MLLVVLIVTAIIILIVAFSIILSRKCPNCKKIQLEFKKSVEIDRYNTTKRVEEKIKNKNGETVKTIEKIVPITKAVYENYYECKNCGHVVIRREEKEL
mgnify:CR=1 FL=1